MNIILWDGDIESFNSPYEAVPDDGTAQIGGTYSNGVFSSGTVMIPVPESVTPLQIRRAIRQSGIKSQVDSIISTLDEETVESWEYANSIERNNSLIAMAQSLLGMTDSQVDDLFRLASTLL
jgi:hypothetical protein